MTIREIPGRAIFDVGVSIRLPRSRFYCFEPIGVGSPSVESLTSYISRLAYKHCVSVKDLIVHELLPIFGREYLLSRQNNSQSAFWKDTSALNSVNASTHDWVQLLEKLTQKQGLCFLTMLPWSDILSPRDLIRKMKAWCPLCYGEWSRNNLEIYEPLLWSIEAVRMCRKHKCLLTTSCYCCGRHSYILTGQAQPGYCSHCGQWLGNEPDQNFGQLPTSDECEWQYWVTGVVGKMLAATPGIISLLRREKFAETIGLYLNEVYGNVSALSRRLQVSRRTIRDWKRGLQVPQLASLLQLCSILEISPLQIFSSNWMSAEPYKRTTFGVKSNLSEESKKFYRVFDTGRVRDTLIAELQRETGVPVPMSVVAKRLKYDPSFLCKHFPELCQAISDRYRVYRKKKREERRQKILDEVRQVTYKVHSQGLYPSHERVRSLLAKPGSIKEPGALVAWHEALRELGWEDENASSD